VAVYAGVVEGVSAPLGVLGLAALAGALLRASAGLVPWALALLGGSYALALVVADGDLDARAGFVAAGLLLAGELAYWSIEARRWPLEHRAAARAAVPAGVQLVQVAGVLGAIGALLTLALLARR
jgi:hypothetical protein